MAGYSGIRKDQITWDGSNQILWDVAPEQTGFKLESATESEIQTATSIPEFNDLPIIPEGSMLCPYCNLVIKDGALKCKHCKSKLDNDPITTGPVFTKFSTNTLHDKSTLFPSGVVNVGISGSKDEISELHQGSDVRFDRAITNLLKAPIDQLNSVNPRVLEYAEAYNSRNKKKQWSFAVARYTAYLSILFVKLFGRPRLGYDIFYRDQISKDALYAAYKTFAPFNLETEIPLVLCRDTEPSMVITDCNFYYNLMRSKKVSDIAAGIFVSNSRISGMIPLSSIRTVSIKATFFMQRFEVRINGDLVGGSMFYVNGDAKILSGFLEGITTTL